MSNKLAACLGGDKWKKIIAKAALHDIGLKVGILESSKNAESDMPVAEYAFYNEYGTDQIESRPFMRNTVKEKTDSWAAATAQLLEGKTMQAGAFEHAFAKLGEIAVSDIQTTIQSGMTPANAPSTVKQKVAGRTTLQDSFDMFDSVAYEVTK